MTNEEEGTPVQEDPTPVEPTSPVTSLLSEVDSLIKGSGDKVRETVISRFVGYAVDARVQAVEQHLNQRADVLKELRKLKPDQIVRDASGAVVSEGYSADQYKKLEEAKKRLEKIDNALTLALEKGDFSKVLKTN
jgi:hypothetical protein